MMELHTYPNYKDHSINDNTWHVVTFKAKPEQRREITRWCYQTYGEPGFRHLTHDTRWKDSIQWGEVYFNRKSDLEWFILRWT